MGNLRLQQLAGYVLVRLQSAFTLAWDGTSAVYIKMSPEFLGWTHGLCGNNNADMDKDVEFLNTYTHTYIHTMEY